MDFGSTMSQEFGQRGGGQASTSDWPRTVPVNVLFLPRAEALSDPT